ncbi:MAG: hypothetical protein E7091_04110 [Bacteroidales bacterium]|nr:hypothetical protein [Bacteroidales bacterium]
MAKARSIRMRIVDENGNEEDGATHIGTAGVTTDGQQPIVVYDLQGRRVDTPTGGIYIVNGKKIVWK